jgi:hypothetical protein
MIQGKWLFFILSVLMGFSAYAADLEKALEGVSSPTDGYIKSVQFIVSIYRESGGTRKTGSTLQANAGSGDTKEKGTNTETMRVADGQAAFIGSSQEIPIPVVTAVRADNNASVKAVEYKKLESGIELRPHLMGRYVQLEIVEKDETWNDQTKAVDTSKVHSVVTVPLDQWSKVKGTLNDNEDIEDIYATNRERGEELWVKIELAPN